MASTYQWNGGNGLANDPSQWTLLSGPADGGIPQNGDTAIATAGTITFGTDTKLSDNILFLGAATLSFTGDSGISVSEPTVDAETLISTAVPAASTAETSVIDSAGVFVNAGTILADGPAGSLLTLAVTQNGSTVAGQFVNIGSIGVDAGNTLDLTVGSNATVSDNGQITVDGTGALLTTPGPLYIGNAGTGALQVLDGAVVTDQGTLIVGGQAGDSGQITIGAGSTLQLTGTSQLTQQFIIGGALAANGTPAATGTVTVTGTGALLSSNGPIAIGRDGPGTLIVENGGSVSATTANSGTTSAIAVGQFGAGSITIDGAGSTLTSNGLLFVGRGGTGSVLLENSGELVLAKDVAGTAAELFIGVGNSTTLSQTGGTGTVTVTSGAVLNSGSIIDIGGRNDQGTLVVDGGTVESLFIGLGFTTSIGGTLYGGTGIVDIGTSGLVETLGTATTTSTVAIGDNASTTGTINVAGGSLASNGEIVVGNAGTGALSVSSGGSVTAGAVGIGTTSTGVGTVTVNGGALSESAGFFTVGAAGTGVVTIEAGGTVTATKTAGPAVDIGLSLNSPGSVTVTGTHSLFQINGQFIVGDLGSGTLLLSAGASVDATGQMGIGNQGGSNATVTVDASNLTVSNGLFLGGAVTGSGSTGVLIIRNGGSVGVSGGGGFTTLGIGQSAGSSGTVTLTGGSLDVAGTLAVGNSGTGELSASQGSTLTTSGFTVGGSGTGSMTLDASSLTNTGGVTIGGATASAGSLFVQDGAVITSTGSVGAGWDIGQSAGGSGTITVNAATLSASGGFFGIGVSGTGDMLVEAGGTVTTGETSGPGFDIGNSTGGKGTVTVTGTHSLLQVNGVLVVGDAGSGTLSVAAGASVDATGGFDIGNSNGGSGSVTVDAATLTSTDGLNMGNLFGSGSDSGSLTVQDGGTVGVSGTTPASLSIGSFAGTSGTITVNDATFTTSVGNVQIGASGTGDITIEAGGTVTSTTTMQASVGSAAGSTGAVTVTGTHSLFQLDGALDIGSMGAGSLTLSAGGSVDTQGLGIGVQNGASGDVVVDNAALSETGELSVGGGFGSGTSSGTLTIRDGGSVTAAGGAFAGIFIAQAASSTGTVTVDAGSLSETSGGIDVGSVGTGELTVQAGGTVTSTLNSGPAVDIGGQSTANGSVTVTGTASLLQVNGQLNVGDQGIGSLSVAAGGSADVTGGLVIGVSNGGSGTATVDDAALTASDGLVLGNLFGGGSDSGSLTVQDGGTVGISGNGSTSFAIGASSGGSGTVIVNGAALSATLGVVAIGQSGTGDMTIEAGGTVTTTTSVVTAIGEASGGTGAVTVTGTASLFQVNGQLQVGSMSNGALTVSSGGSVNVTTGLVIANQTGIGGTVSVDNGALSAGGIMVGASGTGDLTIDPGGTVTATASLGSALDIGQLSSAKGTVTLSGAGSLLQVNGQLTVGDQGIGTLSVGAGTTADITGSANLGNQGTASGAITVSGAGALLEASSLNLDSSPGDTATGVLTIGTGGTVSIAGGQAQTGGTVVLQGGLLTDTGGSFNVTAGGNLRGAGTFSGSLIADGTATATGGLLTITGNAEGNSSGAGNLVISPASTLSVGGVISTPNVTFASAGTGEVLGLGSANNNGGTLHGFAPGDTIWLTGVSDTGFTVQAAAGANTLTFTDNSSFIGSLDLAGGSYAGDLFTALPDTNGGTDIVFACYAQGTRIATARGPVAIEALQPGERVVSAFGGTVPVVWLGHRRVDCRRHPRPLDIWPVRVRAGAFADHLPSRDLLLSPDHAVYVDDVLVPIRTLINGVTIVQQQVDSITYFHVELPTHDVILAEGLPAESYLDTGNRGAFANGGPVVAHTPDFAQRVWQAEACAPQITHGPIHAAIAARLQARMRQIAA